MRRAALCLLGLAAVQANVLDDYVSAPEAVYKYENTGQSFKTDLGGTAYVLNVTSLAWLDEATVTGPHGNNLWSHLVVVVVPKVLKLPNVSLAYLTGNCNSGTPKPPGPTDEELLSVDIVTHDIGAIGIVVYQLPNCPLVFAADPLQKPRSEDAMIAWTWHAFIESNATKPEALARLPMTKAAFQCMRAAQDFVHATVPAAAIEGWVVAGASKRGWTTWSVGGTTCTGEHCVTIAAIAPLVPIAPNIHDVIHRQWQSYGGFTFAFKDYTDLNLTQYVDDPRFAAAMEISDPKNYGERLSRIPKFVVVSSDDEFMSMDWTNIWYDDFQQFGETHLLIVQDSEHSLATAIPEVVSSLSAAVEAVATGNVRPTFDYVRDTATGALTVTVPAEFRAAIDKVELRHASTLTDVRRDFRWVRLAGNDTTPCDLPDIKLPKPIFGGNCIQPILWTGIVLNQTAPGVYSATPPAPRGGRWTGYYVELFFKSSLKSDYLFTTPGFTWPDTLPFADCKGAECTGRLL